MCIVLKVGIVSNLFSNTINHKLRHCLLTPLFKDFFFSGYTVAKKKQIERKLFVLAHTSVIFRAHIDKFSSSIVFHKEHCPEITVA